MRDKLVESPDIIPLNFTGILFTVIARIEQLKTLGYLRQIHKFFGFPLHV